MKKKNKALKVILIVILSILVIILLGIAAFFIYRSARKSASYAENTEHTGLYVDGTALKNAEGKEIVMKGVNHAHCWYKDKDEEALDAIAATGANTVRIVCANGIQWEKDSAEELAAIIKMVHDRDMYVVVEVHDGTGSDDIEVLKQIASYWCEMSEVLKGTEDYCILNIANEWCGSWNGSTWSEGYTTVIPILRDAGIKNVLMVDTAGWGQCGIAADLFGMKVFESDSEHNTMFSVHMYGLSGGSELAIRYNLNALSSQNLCVCVGEFGYTHSDGDVKEDYLMDYCDENKIGYLAWSWKGNSGGVEYLDLANSWDGSDLSEWGEKVIKSFKKSIE